MFITIKKLLVYLGFALPLVAPTVGFCGIWELAQDAITQNKSHRTYHQVLSHLSLLTSDENIIADPAHKDTLMIAGGYIVVTPDAIRSFKNPEDHMKGVAPEFEFVFETTQLGPFEETKTSSEIRRGLENIRISLDIIPSHSYFKDAIGSWSYEKFVVELQTALRESLSRVGAEVSILRPKVQLNADTLDEMNKNPAHIVISTQFNNSQQECMVTFCGGNILKAGFNSDTQRARFIEAALTGKHIYSAGLGACIAKHCQTKLNVQPLGWEHASFEGNACAVPASAVLGPVGELQESKGNFNGIAMRNLIHNGLFAKAVVIPFPDMKWICSEIEAGHEFEWIAKYSQTITEAVLDYVSNHSVVFE